MPPPLACLKRVQEPIIAGWARILEGACSIGSLANMRAAEA